MFPKTDINLTHFICDICSHTWQLKNVPPVAAISFVTALDAVGSCNRVHSLAVSLGICDALLFQSPELSHYCNCVSIVPVQNWDTIVTASLLFQSPELSTDVAPSLNMFAELRLDSLLPCVRQSVPALTIALVHAFWHHSSQAQLGRIPQSVAIGPLVIYITVIARWKTP